MVDSTPETFNAAMVQAKLKWGGWSKLAYLMSHKYFVSPVVRHTTMQRVFLHVFRLGLGSQTTPFSSTSTMESQPWTCCRWPLQFQALATHGNTCFMMFCQILNLERISSTDPLRNTICCGPPGSLGGQGRRRPWHDISRKNPHPWWSPPRIDLFVVIHGRCVFHR